MQCAIRQRRHLECNSLWHAEPMKTDERIGDVVATSQVENEPCCGLLRRDSRCSWLVTYLDGLSA